MEDFDAIKAMKHEYLTRIQREGRAEILRLALRAMKRDGVEVLRWQQYNSINGIFIVYFRTCTTDFPNVKAFEGMINEIGDLMEMVFGDAVEVTIDRDGTLTMEEMK